MALGCIRRGEIYAIKSGDDAAENNFTRPGLVISANSDNMNSHGRTVIVAMLTTYEAEFGIKYGPFNNTGRPSFVCCNNILTVTKTRLGRLMGELSENQMKEVESLLDEALDLGYVDDAPLREKETECAALKEQIKELRAEVAELKKLNDNHTDELLTRDVELAIAKRMYEKAVGIIAAMKAEPDLPERPKGPPKKVVEPPEPKVEEQPKLVDINSAKFSVLRGIGLSNDEVLTLIKGRPYKSVGDIRSLPGMTKQKYEIIKKKICCVIVEQEPEAPKVDEPIVAVNLEPPKPEKKPKVKPEWDGIKVNVNTVTTAKELMQRTGLSIHAAQGVLRYRKEHGPFETLEDLLKADGFGKIAMKRYGHMLEV